MEYEDSFGEVSATHLKEEGDVLAKIIENLSNHPKDKKLYFVAEDFEGKHFRYLFLDSDYKKFIQRLEEILSKFVRFGVIRQYSVENRSTYDKSVIISIQIKDSINGIKNRKNTLEMFIDAKEHQKFLEPHYKNTWWNNENIFCVKKVDGSITPMAFHTVKNGKSGELSFFRTLYELWNDSGGKPTLKSDLERTLNKKYPRLDISGEMWFMNIRRNINKKIQASHLEDYIEVVYDRKNKSFLLKFSNLPELLN